MTGPCHPRELTGLPWDFCWESEKETLFLGVVGLEGGRLVLLVVICHQTDCEDTSSEERGAKSARHFQSRAPTNTVAPKENLTGRITPCGCLAPGSGHGRDPESSTRSVQVTGKVYSPRNVGRCGVLC